MKVLLVLPLIVPVATAALSLASWGNVRLQRLLSVLGSAALLAVSLALLGAVREYGPLATQVGNWPAPFGITLVADRFSAIMVVLAGLIGLAVSIYSLEDIGPRREAFGYHPLLQILLMGVCGSFLTGDLFNLYVWFEVMLMSSFVLMTLGAETPQLQGGIKYVALNLISSGLFLAGVGILYGMVGTLNMADLAGKLATQERPGLITALSMLFFLAFGLKAAVFPLFFWLPASYHTPPVAISALFAGLLTKVGVYALIRIYTLIFTQHLIFTHTLLLIVSALTMLTGVLGAASQFEVRRILSFHIISQIGYMTLGLALAGLTGDRGLALLALAGSVFYIAHHIIVKTNLFLIAGVMQRLGGSFHLKDLGGLFDRAPILAILFLIPALSLAGIPPLSGFFAKLILIQAGLRTEKYAVVAVALAVGLLTLFSMTKIWSEAFWKTPPEQPQGAETIGWARWGPIVVLAGITVLIGVFAQPLFELSMEAAEELLDSEKYRALVLGGTP